MEHKIAKTDIDLFQQIAILNFQPTQLEISPVQFPSVENTKFPSSNEPKRLQEITKENTGRWTHEEHQLFLQGLKLHGKDWKKVSEMIETRTVVQIRTHAQKYFQKVEKAKQQGLPIEDVTMDTRSCTLIAPLKKKKVPKKKLLSQLPTKDFSPIIESNDEKDDINSNYFHKDPKNEYISSSLQPFSLLEPPSLRIIVPTEEKPVPTFSNMSLGSSLNTLTIDFNFQPAPKFSVENPCSSALINLKHISPSFPLNPNKLSSGIGGNSPTCVADKNVLSFCTFFEKQESKQSSENNNPDWFFESLPFEFFPGTSDQLNQPNISLGHPMQFNAFEERDHEKLEATTSNVQIVPTNHKCMQTGNTESLPNFDFSSDIFDLNSSDQFFSIDSLFNKHVNDLSFQAEYANKKQKMYDAFNGHDDLFHSDYSDFFSHI